LNSLNGVPACADNKLLSDILRQDWNFRGYVISDAGALEHIVNSHHYVPTYLEAAVAAVKAGCNLELTGDGSGWVFSYLLQVVIPCQAVVVISFSSCNGFINFQFYSSHSVDWQHWTRDQQVLGSILTRCVKNVGFQESVICVAATFLENEIDEYPFMIYR